MRLGIVLEQPFVRDAAEAERLGFELGWLDESTTPAPLVAAAAFASATVGLRIVACVAAGPHPMTLAEDAAVADLLLRGRLVLGLESADAGLLDESVALLQQALTPRPLRHIGERWRVPALMPEHEQIPDAVRVTPAPAQLELPIWLRGSAAQAVARRRCLSFVGEDSQGDALQAAAWEAVSTALGPPAERLRRPALRGIRPTAAGLDGASLVSTLLRDRERWGMDVAILKLPASLGRDGRATVLHQIATEVRPRVQLSELPPGLEQYWASDRRAL